MTDSPASTPRTGSGLSPAAASSLGQLLGRPVRVDNPAAASRSRPLPPRPPRILGQTQILDATLACLLEDGYDGTTIRTIARRLDCAVGSIYRYFRDKRDLLEQVTYQHFRPALDAFEARGDLHGLNDSMATYARIATGHAQLYRLMFWLASVGDAQTLARQPVIVAELIQAWSRVLGSPEAAEARWILLHGRLILGSGFEKALMPAPGAAEAPTSSWQSASVEEEEEEEEEERGDDLTLL